MAEAAEVLAIPATDVGVFSTAAQDMDGRRAIVAIEADTFFESTFWLSRRAERGA